MKTQHHPQATHHQTGRKMTQKQDPTTREDTQPMKEELLADKVAHTDFATLIRHQTVDNLSMLPHKVFIIENIKQETTREEDHLRSLLLNMTFTKVPWPILASKLYRMALYANIYRVRKYLI